MNYRTHTVVIRGFTKEGYHRDLARMDEQQIRSTYGDVTDAISSMHTGLIGIGVRIDPSKFPEMAYFEVVIQDDRTNR